jgi:hypothetical protein
MPYFCLSADLQYDFVIDTSEGKGGDAFWVRSSLCRQNTGYAPAGYNGTAYAVLRYVDEWSLPSRNLPTTSDWTTPSLANGTSCPDLADLVPVIKEDAPKSVVSSWILVCASIFP